MRGKIEKLYTVCSSNIVFISVNLFFEIDIKHALLANIWF